MPPIPKFILGVLLILMGIAGVSGCAAKKNAEISSLQRLLTAQRERIDGLQASKADMQRLIDLQTADVKRAKEACLQAKRERGLRPMAASGNGVWSPSQSQESLYTARVRSTAAPINETRPRTWRGAYVTSEIVSQAQRAMKQAYYYHGPIDGVYGRQTRRALAAYQRAQGLAIGDLTLETLRSLGLQPPEPPITADMRR